MAKHNQAGASADGTAPEPSPGAGAGAAHRDQTMFVHRRPETAREHYFHLTEDDVRRATASAMRLAAEKLLTTPCMFAFGQAFTIPQVAEKLGISVSQVLNHVADGTLQAVNVGRGAARRDLRVLDEDLDAFAERRKVAPAGPDWSPAKGKPSAARSRKQATKTVAKAGEPEQGSFSDLRKAILEQREERP